MNKRERELREKSAAYLIEMLGIYEQDFIKAPFGREKEDLRSVLNRREIMLWYSKALTYSLKRDAEFLQDLIAKEEAK